MKGIALRCCCFLTGIAALALASCKSTPVEPEPAVQEKSVEESIYVPPSFEEVQPLALLGEGFGIYIAIPASKHVSLTASVLTKEVEKMSRKDAETVAKHIDLLCAGQGGAEDASLLEVAASGMLPTVAVKTTFTKKNGWTKNSYDAVSTENALRHKYPHTFSYYSREDSEYKIAFTSQELFCLSQDIAAMLERYAVRPEVADTPYNQWISQESDDILFYVTRPEVYLQRLIGRRISVGTDYMRGRLAYQGEERYDMTLTMHAVSPKAVPALKSLLMLSFGLSGATITQTDSETVELSNVSLTEQEIIDMLVQKE